jgi:hypothetical protein
LDAVLKPMRASAVLVGMRPVHARATAYRSRTSRPATGAFAPASLTETRASESRGPWVVERTVIVWSSPPATRILSTRVSSGTYEPSRR